MNRSFVLTRRSLLACAAAAPLAVTLRPARAAGDVYVRAGANFTPVNIAVTPFAGDDAKIGAVTTNDFAHSVFLTPINPTSFPEAVTNPDARPNVDAWKTINAQFVLTGRVAPSGDKIAAQKLQGHGTTKLGVEGAVYDPHAALSQPFLDGIMLQGTADEGVNRIHSIQSFNTGNRGVQSRAGLTLSVPSG